MNRRLLMIKLLALWRADLELCNLDSKKLTKKFNIFLSLHLNFESFANISNSECNVKWYTGVNSYQLSPHLLFMTSLLLRIQRLDTLSENDALIINWTRYCYNVMWL